MRQRKRRLQHALLLLFAAACSLASKPQKLPEDEGAGKIDASPLLPFAEVNLRLHAASPGFALGSVSGIAIDRNGLLYIVQRGPNADPVLVFTRHGELLRSWGRHDLTLPHSLRLDPQGNVWVIDAGSSKVIKYTSHGRRLLTVALVPVPDTGSAFRGATDVAFAPNGHVFITDGYGNARVVEYTAKGREVRQWGSRGTGPGHFHLPHAIRIGIQGTVYVADRENGRVEKFDTQGKFLGEYEHLGRCYALALHGGVLWATAGPLNQDPGAPGWLVAIDAETGRLLGHLAVPEPRMGHALDVAPSGEVLVTAGDGLLVFKKR